MRALFIDPYLDSLGGGERYTLTLVSALQERGWQTALLWDGKSVHEQVQRKFNLDIGQTVYLPRYHFTGSWFSRIAFLQTFDLVFSISDGSLPLLAGKQNIVHFQVPFHDTRTSPLGNFIKKQSIHNFVSNSHFTKATVDKEYGINSRVIYPPVDVRGTKSGRKQNIILYVARFSDLLQNKGHLTALATFKRLYDQGTLGYKLLLAGSTEVGATSLVNRLRQLSRKYPVEIILNPRFADLQKLYARAKFFWAMAGVDVDEGKEPEKCEHFGMSMVEAMAAGCVPLAVKKGGFREIISHGKNGIHWDTVDELINQTARLIKQPSEVRSLSQRARERAEDFSKQRFVGEFMGLIKG